MHTYIYIYIYESDESGDVVISSQQLFRSVRAHQYSSDQMKILKDQGAQTAATIVSVVVD